jgi:hypothetical protein
LQLLFYLQAAAAAEHFRTSEGIVVVTPIGPPAFLKLGRVWILRRVEGWRGCFCNLFFSICVGTQILVRGFGSGMVLIEQGVGGFLLNWLLVVFVL